MVVIAVDKQPIRFIGWVIMDAVISIMQVFLPPKAHLGAMVIDHSWVVKSIHNLISALLGKKNKQH